MKQTKMSECYSSNLEHLLAELKRIDMRLHLQVMSARQADSHPGDDKFRGLYISESEIDNIVSTPSPLFGDTSAVIAELPHHIEKENGASQPEGVTLRLHQLEHLFHLSAFDVDVLLLCILPELDLRYQRLYAYLQDDVTKKSPTVDLVLHLLCESFEDRLKARQAFSPEAPLLRYHLLRLHDEQGQRPNPLLAKSLQVDERIIGYLLGTSGIDARLLPFAHLLHPEVRPEDVILPDDIKHRLHQLIARFKEAGLICYFRGSAGVGRQTTAEAVCHELGVPLLSVDVNQMAGADIPPELSLPLVFREGRLQDAALYLNGSDTLLGEKKGAGPGHDSLMTELSGYPRWIFLAGERRWQPGELDTPFICIEFPEPPYSVRRELWERYCNHQSPLSADVDLADLAGKFRLSGEQIANAVATARSLALWRDPENGLITAKDLFSACRQQSSHKLDTLAFKIEPKYDWDDIVLPRDQIEELHEICSYVKHHHTVYGDWGFGRKLSRGTGLNVLFAGPSGTGKTLAAEIMAHELEIDLYKIDLSAIVSKYIGETEKNLDQIFKEGQMANAILFFDEADALFGKRSEVRDSHDRYANIEIAYLLQKMEEYDGMVILATNLRKNMDEAFARRMHFAVEFPVPEEADRYRIWQSIFPGEAPLARNIDLAFMARQFRISGGNIKNIALGAAFFAAEDGGAITMENLIRATKREYQKMGKLCTEVEFAHYFELVKG